MNGIWICQYSSFRLTCASILQHKCVNKRFNSSGVFQSSVGTTNRVSRDQHSHHIAKHYGQEHWLNLHYHMLSHAITCMWHNLTAHALVPKLQCHQVPLKEHWPIKLITRALAEHVRSPCLHSRSNSPSWCHLELRWCVGASLQNQLIQWEWEGDLNIEVDIAWYSKIW